jgi:hypothetical protein
VDVPELMPRHPTEPGRLRRRLQHIPQQFGLSERSALAIPEHEVLGCTNESSYGHSLADNGGGAQAMIELETVCPGVVATDRNSLRHTTVVVHASDVHDDVDGQRDRFANAVVGQPNVRRQDTVSQPRERLLCGVRMDSREASQVPGVERL